MTRVDGVINMNTFCTSVYVHFYNDRNLFSLLSLLFSLRSAPVVDRMEMTSFLNAEYMVLFMHPAIFLPCGERRIPTPTISCTKSSVYKIMPRLDYSFNSSGNHQLSPLFIRFSDQFLQYHSFRRWLFSRASLL